MNSDDGISNNSGNRPFEDVLRTFTSRRNVLAGGLGMAATTFLAGSGMALADGKPGNGPKFPHKHKHRPLLDFEPTLNNGGAVPLISSDYEYDIILPWGDPIVPSGPAFLYPPSAADQEKQIGIGHDGMHFFPIRERRGDDGNDRGVLCLNCEFGDNGIVIGKNAPDNLDDVRVSQHAHGVTIVEIARKHGKWRTVDSRLARRIHVNTPVRFSGPAAKSGLLKTPAGNDPEGTVNNCAMGVTPWGTYLTCEENFNGYFGASGAFSTPERARYGFSAGGFGYGWHNFDPRFDLSSPDYTNEENRFGWVVEIDPMEPRRKPVKRTALGRFKHEGATTVVGRGGRAVVYMGDDERFDYIYKFVSSENWKSLMAQGKSPLDHGRLYVAKFNDDGTGEWIELTIDNPVLAARFSDQAEVLTFARIAGDEVGATPMDRPEWSAVGPDGDVFFTLTNNTRRGVGSNPATDAANPLGPNPWGHIIRMRDSHDHVGETFAWDIFVLAQDTLGNPTYEFGSPDGLFADPDGRLFIQTDGDQPSSGQNQLVVADIGTGEFRRLLAGVSGDEITGITFTPDRRTMFVNSQHPGVILPGVAGPVPRDATFVITRKDGGIVGS